MIFILNYFILLSSYYYLTMSSSFVPYYVRFCSVATSIKCSTYELEAFRLRAACTLIFDCSDTFVIDNYKEFIDNYSDVLSSGKLSLNDVIGAIWYVGRLYYPEHQQAFMALEPSVLKFLFRDYNLSK